MRRHRRTFLKSVGVISSTLLAGCNANPDGAGKSPQQTTNEGTGEVEPTDTPRRTQSTTSPPDTETPTATPASPLGDDPGPLPEETWPLPSRSITNGLYLPDGPTFDQEPTIDWQVQPSVAVEQDHFDPNFSTPVIADGRLFVVKQLIYGTMQSPPERHLLLAYTARSGEKRWEQPIRHDSSYKPPAAPALRGDEVLVGHDRSVRAYGFDDGTGLWRRSIGEPIYAIYPTPRQIYLRTHRSIRAVSAGGGDPWTTELDHFPGAMAIGLRNLFVGVSRRLLALDPETGTTRWNRTLPATGGYGIDELVTVAGGVVVRQNSGDLYAFDDSGKPVWHLDGANRSISTDGARLYTGAEGRLRALDVGTGSPVWELACASLEGCDSTRSFGTPVITNGAVYAPIDSGHLVAVRPDDGSLQWSTKLTHRVEAITLDQEALFSVGDEREPLIRRV